MKVTVTRQDIEDGAEHFRDICGCPIWYALHRALGLSDNDHLIIPFYEEARLGKIVFQLPSEALEFQRHGRKGKPLNPFTFETEPKVNPKVRVTA